MEKKLTIKRLKKISLSYIAIFIIAFIVLNSMFNRHYWTIKNKIISYDVISYYSYLPAAFIYKDVSLDFMNKPGDYSDKFWPIKAPTGKRVIKTSMGMSFLYSPFFFIAHIYALNSHYQASGYSIPYRFALMMSTVFYLLIGLLFLRKVLKIYFSEVVTAITLIAVFFGTNLFYYSIYRAVISHAYSFSMFAVFIYLTLLWYKKQSLKNTIFLGLLLGLISLVRPSNIVIILFFIFFGVNSFKDLWERILKFLKLYPLVLVMIFSFLIVWLPQFIYWKVQTGFFLYNSYSNNEHFFFNNPQIIRGLFSYRKGWLLYTPIMIFALLGIVVLYKKERKFFLPILIFQILNTYIILSWWCWWYGGSFGMRPFIDSYSILAIPFAAFIEFIFKKKMFIKIPTLVIIILLIFYNLFQTSQYNYGVIHWDSMSKEAYWAGFGKLKRPKNFKNYLLKPDYKKAKEGIQAVMPYK